MKDTLPSLREDNRLVVIDVLRGIAVSMVMIRHLAFNKTGITGKLSSEAGQYPGDWFNQFASFGEYGVHLFLVLSGFCIHFRWAKKGDGSIPFLAFWKRRLVRLYPPFLVVLVLSLTSLFVLHGVLLKSFPNENVAAWFGYDSVTQLTIDLALLLTLTQNLNGASQRVGNGPFWSLALEEQLYMLYFPFLALRRKYGWPVALGVPVTITILWRITGMVVFETPPSFWFVTAPAFWCCWCLGALAAESYTGRVSLPETTRSGGLLIVATAIAIALHELDRSEIGIIVTIVAKTGVDVAFGCVAFLLIQYGTRFELRVRDAMQGWSFVGPVLNCTMAIGICSYSIYLTHDITFKAVKQILVEFGVPLPIVLAGRLASGIAVGCLFYFIVEKRFLKMSRRVRVESVKVDGSGTEADVELIT
ncbi:MAG: peptidoglycan/LPS O-acetylase OafA/YrhL [Pirellulaceae bacterium]|jgi:peptidoglycan/LPS O-acetylase OafA/YrhL